MDPWAALVVEPDGSVAVYVHGWILAGRARTPEELWKLANEAYAKPESFWKLFYQQLDRDRGSEPRLRKGGDPALAALTLDDLGI